MNFLIGPTTGEIVIKPATDKIFSLNVILYREVSSPWEEPHSVRNVRSSNILGRNEEGYLLIKTVSHDGLGTYGLP